MVAWAEAAGSESQVAADQKRTTVAQSQVMAQPSERVSRMIAWRRVVTATLEMVRTPLQNWGVP